MDKNLKNNWICNKYIAHRGIWDNDEIFENTLPAFENAILHNYAIETDVWKIKDGSLVIFHDDTLERLCGVNKNIWDVENLEELKSYTIMQKEKIPTFEEFLTTVSGKVPLLIEIKTYKFDGETEKLVYERLQTYSGEYAIEGFNSYSVYWFKKHAPEVIRGQLSSVFKKSDSAFKNFFQRGITNLLYNKITKPHFVAYDKKYYPNKYLTKAKKEGKLIILWTIKSKEDFEKFKDEVDNIIFDNFLP